jgi:hypothetical protein
MDIPPAVTAVVHDNIDVLIVSLGAACLLLLVIVVALWARLRRVARLYRRFFTNATPRNNEEMITGYMDTSESVERRMAGLQERLDTLETAQRSSIQSVNVSRYDAFDDIGGAQSFTLLMLDGERNGVALSGVYSRADVRVYAKEIKAGKAMHPLTSEEVSALEQAGADR